MKREVKRSIVEALQDFGLKSKASFLSNRTSQSCVLAYLIAWTFETESALNLGGSSLDEYLLETENSISELIESKDSIFGSDIY